MKSGKIIALGLLALLPIAMKAQEAQEIEKLNDSYRFTFAGDDNPG